MASEYRDRWIECTSDAIKVHRYYFPWRTKSIPYRSIRAIRRVDIGTFSGKGRIWGTANPHYWASLDPQWSKKEFGLVLDLGRFVHPFITPDNPDDVEAAIREHTNLEPTAESGETLSCHVTASP